MSYNVIPIEKFKKEAKRLIRKYPSLRNELLQLSEKLSENPALGTPLGNNAFKIRRRH
jgi:mRNA-degrading endonuclease RelE of RelBE toxin-antitoxin system